jgi:hypothetical protein
MCCDFDRKVDQWSKLEVLEEEGYSMFVPKEFMVKIELSSVHCLVENKIAQHCTHVLSSASTPMPVTILPTKQNQKDTVRYHQPLLHK